MWKKRGDTEKAREHLHKAIEHFEEMKLDRELQKAREELLELESPEPGK